MAKVDLTCSIKGCSKTAKIGTPDGQYCEDHVDHLETTEKSEK